MINKKYTICVHFGRQIKLEFDVILARNQKTQGMLYVEVDKDGIIVPDRGLLLFNNSMTAISVAYMGFNVCLDIKNANSVSDCHCFECATDLCEVTLYMCETEKWKRDGESIFS